MAGVLLKLGGYGLFRFFALFGRGGHIPVVFVVSTIGGALLGILCCRLADIKVIIAYSSVVHMALIIVAILSGEKIAPIGSW